MVRQVQFTTDEAAYKTHLEQTVSLPKQDANPFKHVTYILGRLWSVIMLNCKAWMAPERVADVFTKQMEDVLLSAEDLAVELAWQSEVTIAKLNLPYTSRNLDIVGLAVLQTELLNKKKALLERALELKARRPADPEPPSPPPLERTPTPLKVVLRRLSGDLMNEVRKNEELYPTPANRRGHRANDGCPIKGKLSAQEINAHLVGPLPYRDYIEYFAAELEKLQDEERDQLLKGLNLWPLLYLYEVVRVRHHEIIESCITTQYLALKANKSLKSQKASAEFKAYVMVHFRKGDISINGRYVKLKEVLDQAEIEQKRREKLAVS